MHHPLLIIGSSQSGPTMLTRARYETVIWVPAGNDGDTTRKPAEFDAIAEFLLDCGAQRLDADTMAQVPAAAAEPERHPMLL